MYPSSEQLLEDIPSDQQRARKNNPQKCHVIIATQNKQAANSKSKTLTSTCNKCTSGYKKGRTIEHFDDFGEQPHYIKDLSFLHRIFKISYCSIEMHLAGHVTWEDNKSTLDGTIGVLKEGLGETYRL